ncbi:hypothetical protein KC349_g4517 [Hortaea werneckii]|nr:hypothetical protein KC349_g4517 [Hortaea werneckii]
MPRRERSPPPPVPPIPAPFRHAYAGIGPSNNPVPSTPSNRTPSNRSPNDHANSLRKTKSAVEMSSAYERKRRTALPPSKLRESVSANEVPSAAESFGHPSRVQAAPTPVDEVNRSRLTTKKSLPNFSLKKPTSAKSLDINASANTRECHAGDVPGSARRGFMGQVSTNHAFFSAFCPSGEHHEEKFGAATASSGEIRNRRNATLRVAVQTKSNRDGNGTQMGGTQPGFRLSRDHDLKGRTQPLFCSSRDPSLRITSSPSDNVDMELLQRNDQQSGQSRLRDTDAISPLQRSELNYEHALEKLGWLDRLKRKAMSAGKDASGPDKRRDAPVNISAHTEPCEQPAAETSGSTRLGQQSSTPDVNANKSGKSPRWTEPVKHVTGVGSLIKPKSPSVESARTFLSKPSPLTSSSTDSLSTSRSKMEARTDPSPLERMQKARMQTATSTGPSHLRDAMGVNVASSERDDPFLDASSTTSSTAPPIDANVLPWKYQKADGSFNAALLGAGGSSNELKYANAAAFKGDSQSSPETPYTPTRSGNQALRAAKSESSIKSTSSLGVINPPSKNSLEYSIENPDHMPHTHLYKAIQTPPPQPPRALSPAEDPEWPRMIAKAKRDIEIHDQKIAQAKEEARIRSLEQEAADERKTRNEMEERLIERSSEFGMVPLKDFMEMTDDELSFYSKTLTAELVSIKERTDAEDAAAQSGISNLFKKGGPSKAQAEVERRTLEKVLFLRDQGRNLEKAQKESLRRFSEASRAMGNRRTGETSRQKNVETPLSSPTAKAETTIPRMAGPAPKPKDVHQQKAAKESPSFIPVAKAGQATALSAPPQYTPSRTSDKSSSFTPDTVKEERGKTLRALRGPSPPSIVQNLPSGNKPIGLGIVHAYGGQVGHADDAAAGHSVNKGKGRALEPTPDSTLQLPRTQGGLGKDIERERSRATSPVSSIHSDEARELETTLARDTNRGHRVSLLSPLDQPPIKVAYRPVTEEGQGEGSHATTTFKVDRNEDFKAMIAAEAAKRARMLNAPGAPIHPAFRQRAGDTGVQNVPSTERLPSREGRGPSPMPAHPAFRTTGAGPGDPVAPATAPVESITWLSEPLRTVAQPPTVKVEGEAGPSATLMRFGSKELYDSAKHASSSKDSFITQEDKRHDSLPRTDQGSLDGTTDTTSKPTAATKSGGAPRVGSLIINTDRLFSPDEEYHSPLEGQAWLGSAAKNSASVHDASVASFGQNIDTQVNEKAHTQASTGKVEQAFGAQVPGLPQMAEPDISASAAQPPAIPPKISKRSIKSYRSGDQVSTPALAPIVETDDSGFEWVQNTDYDPRGDPRHALFEEDWYPGKDKVEASSSVYSRDDEESLAMEANEDEENKSESYGGMNINFDAEIKEIEEWTTPSSQRTNVNSPPTQRLSPSNPDGLNALRADLDLAPLRLHDAASAQPKHPNHEFAFDTEKLMCYMKHNNLSVHGLASGDVSRCSHCARFCCTYAENLYASELPTRRPDVEHIQQQALKAVNRLDAEHPNGIETFDVFLTCAECSKVICPQCVVVCEEVFCREMLCGEHAVEGRCEYHGRG